jgi:hypothetical protein
LNAGIDAGIDYTSGSGFGSMLKKGALSVAKNKGVQNFVKKQANRGLNAGIDAGIDYTSVSGFGSMLKKGALSVAKNKGVQNFAKKQANRGLNAGIDAGIEYAGGSMIASGGSIDNVSSFGLGGSRGAL